MRASLPCVTQDEDISQELRATLELHRKHQTALDASLMNRRKSAYDMMSRCLPLAFIITWVSVFAAFSIFEIVGS